MAEKKIDISRKKKPISISAAKVTPKVPVQPPKPEPKEEKPQKEEAVKQNAKKPRGKPFTSEYQPNNTCGGRPQNDFSYRAMAKIRAKKDPERIQKDLNRLDEIIDNPKSTPAEIAKALEIKIKLNGNFDPQETKDVTPARHIETPLDSLSVEELRTLKALKNLSKGAKK
ncbi:hypothetical protein IJI89_03845 [Candidatus Saccharibacteria bacterium]|nr:hypothetical protein [Candidatus Saccharibacteria bacterium]